MRDRSEPTEYHNVIYLGVNVAMEQQANTFKADIDRYTGFSCQGWFNLMKSQTMQTEWQLVVNNPKLFIVRCVLHSFVNTDFFYGVYI